eukprot:SAG22_NODE_3190_length_1865_cov_1.912797_1_plen_37_part_00
MYIRLECVLGMFLELAEVFASLTNTHGHRKHVLSAL